MHDLVSDTVDLWALDVPGLAWTRRQPCGGDGLPAGEQRNIMTLRHQSLGEIADDSFRASKEARRHAKGAICAIFMSFPSIRSRILSYERFSSPLRGERAVASGYTQA